MRRFEPALKRSDQLMEPQVTDGVLAPFAVEVDADRILEAFPEIEQMLSFDPPGDNLTVDQDDEFTARGINRRSRRFLDQTSDPRDEAPFMAALIHLTSDGDKEAGLATAQEVLDSWLEVNFEKLPQSLRIAEFFKFVLAEMIEYQPFIHAFNANQNSLQARAAAELKQKTSLEQYELLKLLVMFEHPPADHKTDEEAQRDEEVLEWLNSLLLAPSSMGQPGLGEALGDQLAEGVFDEHIARDLLRFLDGLPPERLPEEMVPIRAHISLMERAYQLEMDDESMDRYAADNSAWPHEQRATLVSYRANLAKAFQDIRDDVDSTFKTHGVLFETSDQPIERIDATLTEYLEVHILPRLLTDKRTTTGERIAIIVATEKRKRERKAQTNGHLEVPEPAVAEVAGRQPNELMCIRDGQLHPWNSRQRQAIVDECLREQRGVQAFADDVEKILEFLPDLDLSIQTPSVQQLKRVTVYNDNGGSRTAPLYILRTNKKHAAGLSLKSRQAKKYDVLIVDAGDGTIALAGIVRSDRRETFIRDKNLK